MLFVLYFRLKTLVLLFFQSTCEGFELQLFQYLLVFKAIERLVKGNIIPFNGCYLIVLHPSKSIDQVGAEAGVNILRLEAAQARPVLGPVGEVTCQVIGITCLPKEESRKLLLRKLLGEFKLLQKPQISKWLSSLSLKRKWGERKIWMRSIYCNKPIISI